MGRWSAPYIGAHSASTVSLPLLVLGGCTAGFANPGPDEQDRPFVRRPESVYRAHPASHLTEQVVERPWCPWSGRKHQNQPAPQRRRRGKELRQLKREG